MKKIICYTLLSLSLVLSGCYDEPANSTSEEILILDKLDKRGFCSRGQSHLVSYTLRERKDKPLILGKPFCDMPSAFRSASTAGKCNDGGQRNIADAYKEVMGKSYEEVCNPEVVHTSTETKEDFKQKPLGDVDTYQEQGTKVTRISLDKYKELIDAAQTCNRAKDKLLDLTQSMEPLTDTDYNDVMSLLHNCKRFELEQALQAL